MSDLPAKNLLNDVRQLISAARYSVVNSVNQVMVHTYWKIGQRIVEEEQQGKQRADYGKGLLQTLSTELSKEFGKGFSVSNLANMRQFYITFPIFQTVSGKLSWSHYMALLRTDNESARNFYLKECEAPSGALNLLANDARPDCKRAHESSPASRINPLCCGIFGSCCSGWRDSSSPALCR